MDCCCSSCCTQKSSTIHNKHRDHKSYRVPESECATHSGPRATRLAREDIRVTQTHTQRGHLSHSDTCSARSFESFRRIRSPWPNIIFGDNVAHEFACRRRRRRYANGSSSTAHCTLKQIQVLAVHGENWLPLRQSNSEHHTSQTCKSKSAERNH
jgi:hypothetical protein